MRTGPNVYQIRPQSYHLTRAWPEQVRLFVTTRWGGVSLGTYATANMGHHVGDDLERVTNNRAHLVSVTCLPASVQWLNQVHGTQLLTVCEPPEVSNILPQADGVILKANQLAGAVLTADCLPVFLSRQDAKAVAVVHAGWRGLAAGILNQAVEQLGGQPEKILAFLGPAIPGHLFEVRDDVYSAFVKTHPNNASAFLPVAKGRWRALLNRLAWLRLRAMGVANIEGWGISARHAMSDLGACRSLNPELTVNTSPFFSYRASNVTGRFASVITLDG